MLNSFKEKLNAPSSKEDLSLEGMSINLRSVSDVASRLSSRPIDVRSTTPIGTPPKDILQPPAAPSTAPAAPNASAILEALATIAKRNTAPQPDNAMPVSSTQTAIPAPAVAPTVSQAPAFAPPAPALNLPLSAQFPGLNLHSLATPLATAAPPPAMNAIATPAPVPAMPPQQPVPGTEPLQQQLMLVQLLIQQGIPQEQWGPILAAFSAGNANPALPLAPAWAAPNAAHGYWNQAQSRDRPSPPEANRGGGGGRSPPGRYQRDRSRSPQPWGRDRDRDRDRDITPPRRRDSPIYGEYNGDSPGRHDSYDRRGRGRGGRGRDDYRQRSPPANRRGWSPGDNDRYVPPPGGPKWVDYDSTIGKDNIKGVLMLL